MATKAIADIFALQAEASAQGVEVLGDLGGGEGAGIGGGVAGVEVEGEAAGYYVGGLRCGERCRGGREVAGVAGDAFGDADFVKICPRIESCWVIVCRAKGKLGA